MKLAAMLGPASMLAWAAAFLAAPAQPVAAEPSTKTVKILYTAGWSIFYQDDLIESVERALRDDPERIQLQDISTEWVFYSRGNYLLDVPAGLARADLPAAGLPGEAGAEVGVLETGRALVAQIGNTPYPLLERLLANTQDRSQAEDWRLGVERRKGRAARYSGRTGRRLAGFTVGSEPPRDWFRTVAIHYRLKVDGDPVELVAISNRVGSPARTLRAVQTRLKDVEEPVMLLNMGRVALPIEFHIPAEELLEPFIRTGFRLQAVGGYDIEAGSAALAAATRGPGGPRIRILCANLETKGDPGFDVDRFRIEEVGGVRIGVFSLLPRLFNPRFAAIRAPFLAGDPIAAARTTVAELEREKVDLIVAVSHLSAEDDAKLQGEVGGIDILLGNTIAEPVTRRRNVVELSDWKKERHGLPALVATLSGFSYSELTLTFRDSPAGKELTRVVEEAGPPGTDLPEDEGMAGLVERGLADYLAPQQLLLPDPRGLWPDAAKPKTFYAPQEFWNLAAQILRAETGAEAALLRIGTLGSNLPGGARETYLREWLRPDERIAVLRLPGSALRPLLKRLSDDTVPVLDFASWRAFRTEIWLAGAGIDKEGRIGGRPIADDELYSVAVTEGMLEHVDGLESLASAQEKSFHETGMTETVLGALRRKRPVAGDPAANTAYEVELRGLFEGKTPKAALWRIHLRDLSLQMANTRLSDNTRFTAVRDARIQSVDQTFAQGSMALFSEYYLGRWRWDTGVSADYGRVIIRPPGIAEIENETADRLVAETEARHAFWLRKGRTLPGSVGPFLKFAYDTEFTKPAGIPLRKLFAVKPGLKLYDGRKVQELFVGPVMETDYSTSRPNTEYGWETGVSLVVPLRSSTAKVKAVYQEFAPSRDDTPDDLRRTLDVSAQVQIPVVDNAALAPFVKFYVFEGKRVDVTGYNLLFGVSLAYSRLWKPSY